MENKTRIAVIEMELIDGLYKDWIGKKIQTIIHEDLEVGSKVQVCLKDCISSTNFSRYDNHVTGENTKLGAILDHGSMASMLGVINRIVFSYDGMSNDNRVRNNVYKAKDYDSSLNDKGYFSVKLYDLKNKAIL